VQIGSISLPTEHGPLVLTFGAATHAAAAPKAAQLIDPAPVKRKSDVQGAFATPPPFTQEPWAPIGEG
jgi:hypothetical protein